MKPTERAALAIAALLFLSALFTSYESPLRYIKYFIFPVLVVYALRSDKIYINKILYRNLLLYVLLIGINLVTSLVTGYLTFRFVEESMLILLPLLSATLFCSLGAVTLDKALKAFFWAYAIAFSVYNFKILLNIKKLLIGFVKALTFSDFETESWMAFPFGILTLYFLLEKKYRYGIASACFFLLSFKRISMMAVFAALAAYVGLFVILKIRFRKKLFVNAFITLNLVLLSVLYLFISGVFTKFIYRHTGISVNQFSQGRFQIYNDVIRHFSDRAWFGTSLGFTHDYLMIKYTEISFLHSDILKIFIEMGIISFLIWLFYFMLTNLTNKKAVALVLFINILFLSDNVFIYFDTLFLFYIVLVKFDADDATTYTP